jgi:hypothetical protein
MNNISNLYLALYTSTYFIIKARENNPIAIDAPAYWSDIIKKVERYEYV